MTSIIHVSVTSPTTSNTTSEKDFATEHVISAVFGVLLLSCATYVLFSLLVYERVVMVKNQLTRAGATRSLVVDRMADWFRWLCLAAAAFITTRYVVDLVEIFQRNFSNSPCFWVRQTKAALQCGGITCLYLVLWLRQYKFYHCPVYQHLINKPVRFFSGAVIVIMAVANIVTITVYVAARKYHRSNRGCVLLWSSIWTKLPGVLLFLFSISFQLILLGLLLYPLYKHRLINSTKNMNQIEVIRRVTGATIAAVVGSGAVAILSITVLSGNYGALRQVVYGVDMMITLFAVLLSFRDWRIRLWPCTRKWDGVRGSVRRSPAEETTDVSITHVTPM